MVQNGVGGKSGTKENEGTKTTSRDTRQRHAAADNQKIGRRPLTTGVVRVIKLRAWGDGVFAGPEWGGHPADGMAQSPGRRAGTIGDPSTREKFPSWEPKGSTGCGVKTFRSESTTESHQPPGTDNHRSALHPLCLVAHLPSVFRFWNHVPSIQRRLGMTTYRADCLRGLLFLPLRRASKLPIHQWRTSDNPGTWAQIDG
jgi:hypothetical protein